MKRVLFRGKIEQSIYEPIADNGWVYGNYIECLDDNWRNIDENGNDITETRPMIFTIIESRGMKQHARIPVIPKTLGQYTGVDLGNKMLFSNDIVLYDDSELGIVEYCGEHGYPAFDVQHLMECYVESNLISVCKAGDCELTIVGNTTDDPELAEKIKKGENFPESVELIQDGFLFQCPKCGKEETFLESMSVYDTDKFKVIKGEDCEFRELEEGIVMCNDCYTIFRISI